MYDAGHSEAVIALLVEHAAKVGGWVMIDQTTEQPIPYLPAWKCSNLAKDGTYCSTFETRPVITFTKSEDGKKLKSITWAKAKERVIWHLVSADKSDWMDRRMDPENHPDFEEAVEFEALQVLLDEMDQLRKSLVEAGKYEDALTMQSALSILSDNPRPCLSRTKDGVWVNCIHHPLYHLPRKVETYRDKDGNPMSDLAKAMNLAKVYIRPGNPMFNYQFPIEGQYWSEMDYLMAWAGLHRHVAALIKKYEYTPKRAWKTAKTRLYKEHPTFKALEAEKKSGQVPKEVWAQCCKDASKFLEFMDEKVHEEDAPYAMRLRWVKDEQVLTPSVLHKCPASFNMDEGKRAQWLLLHDIWGRSLTRINPFPGSWVKTGDDPQYAANHSAWGFSRRSRSAKCELTKCSNECESCIQDELVYPEVGPKGIQLVVDTSVLLSDNEGLVEMAIELLATLDGLKHRTPVNAENDDLQKEVIRKQYDFSTYDGDYDDGADPYLRDPLKKMEKPAEGTHKSPYFGLSSSIKTPDQWERVVDSAFEKTNRRLAWFKESTIPQFRKVTVVTATTAVYVPPKVKREKLKLYDWMCPAVVELRAKFPEKGILTRHQTPSDPSKVKVIPCGMPVKQSGVMSDPSYK